MLPDMSLATSFWRPKGKNCLASQFVRKTILTLFFQWAQGPVVQPFSYAASISAVAV